MYEGGIRVPAFISWKGKIEPGSHSDNQGMLMDLFPTFCEIAGAEVPDDLDGISLLPTLLGKQDNSPERTIFWVRREGGPAYGGQAYYAARQGDYKILQNTPFEPIQFFNLKEDPYETNPLDQFQSDAYSNLRSQLQEHIQKSGSIPWQK
jgi:arylsulfatase A-like enzyme